MTIEFEGPIWYWRGPAPFNFVTVPKEQSDAIQTVVRIATYGWGMVPVDAQIGETVWYTALWPKDSLYILPLKDAVRKAERLAEGDCVRARLEVILERR